MNTVYLDTNIYLDYLLDRVGETGRKLGDCATQIFWKIAKGELKLVVSDWNIKELNNQIEMNKLTALFALLKKNVIKVYMTEIDIEQAKSLSKENWDDALHALLAKKGRADILVTRNISHFHPFSSIIEPRLPENVC